VRLELSSANKAIEAFCAIDEKIRSKISKILEVLIADNEKASYLTAEGKYIRKQEPGQSSQQFFIENVVS